MKNTIKIFGIIALVAIIGFSMISCDNPTNGGNGGTGGGGTGGNGIGGGGTGGGAVTPAIISWSATPAGSPTTNVINFTFNAAPAGLTASHITITSGTGSATRGNLTGSGTSRALAISNISAGTVLISINRDGIDSGPRTVTLSGTGGGTGAGIQIPAAPTGVTATAQSTTAIQISWNAVSGADSFRVEVRTSATGPWNLLTTVSGTSHTHTDLPPDTQRWYRVFAINSAGTSPASSIANARTQAAPRITVPNRATLQSFLDNILFTSSIGGIPIGNDVNAITIVTYTVGGTNITTNTPSVPANSRVVITVRIVTRSGIDAAGTNRVNSLRASLSPLIRGWINDQGFDTSFWTGTDPSITVQ